MISIDIDKKAIRVPAGTTILEAARQLGIEIPTLCFHKGLTPYGACRVCTVEVIKEGQSSIQSSCSFPVEEGLIVKTNSEKIIKGRRMIVELLLARCPNVALIQEMAKKMGIQKPRFGLKNEDCILCGLCVVVCNEVLGVGAIGFAGRGTDRKVCTPFELPSDECIACGACSYVCPLNLLEMEAEAVKQYLTLPGDARECRYMRMGMISQKVCPNSYQCWHCEIDQRLEDTFGTHPAFAIRPKEAKEITKVDGFLFMPEFYYSLGHVWVKPLNGKLRIGMDDLACRVFGSINNIKPASINSKAEQGKVAWEVKCAEKYAKMLFPFDGTVADINPYIEEDPSLVRKDPYGRGWILTVDPANRDEDLSRLLKGKGARDWMRQRSRKLQRIIESRKDTQLTDEEFITDLPRRLGDKDWETLIKEFFLEQDLNQKD